MAGLVAAALAAGAAPAGAATGPISGAGAGATTRCRSGLVTVMVPTPAGLHVVDRRVDVLLPRDYCSRARRSTSYPVVYVLHGAGDTYSAWTQKTDIASFSRQFDVILVMPDDGHTALAGWYSDWLNHQYQYETFDMSVLPAYMNSHFRTRSHDLGIAGLSMGGFGALSYAARHPGMFKAAASFSGAVDTQIGAPVSGLVFAALNPYEGTPGPAIWGDQEADASVWAAHNPTALAARLRTTRLFLASGTGTPGGAYGDEPTNPGGYALEAGIFQMNMSLVRALDAAGVPHADDFYAGGYHGWPYWQADLHWALPQIVAALAAPKPA